MKWYQKNNQNEHQDKPFSYKYQSPYFKDYNKQGYISDEIIIYAKPNKITSYVFYDKSKQTIFYGVTDSSFTFHPNQVIHIYSEEHSSLEEVPLFIDFVMVNGSKNIQKIRKDNYSSPLPCLMLSFKPRIFSSTLKFDDIHHPVFNNLSKQEIYFPYTGIRKKELLKNWMKFKNGIPRQIPQRA